MPNPNQIKIGFIKSFARKGDRVTVYFPNGKSDRFVANNDITSTEVMVIGDRAFSQDAAQQKLAITTRLFKSRNNYEQGGRYPYFTVARQNNKLIGIYQESAIAVLPIDFSDASAINLNYFNNSINTIAALSLGKYEGVMFKDKSIDPIVKNFAIAGVLDGNVAWAYKNTLPPWDSRYPFTPATINAIPPTGSPFTTQELNKWDFTFLSGIFNFTERRGVEDLLYRNLSSDNFVHLISSSYPTEQGVGSIEVNFERNIDFTPGDLSTNGNYLFEKSWQFNTNIETDSTDETPRSYIISMTGSQTDDFTHNFNATESENYQFAFGNNWSFSGSFDENRHSNGTFEHLRSVPVILNDYQTVYNLEKVAKSYIKRSEKELTWTNKTSSIFYGFADVNLSSGNTTTITQNTNFNVIFNKGEIGLYFVGNNTTIQQDQFNYSNTAAPIKIERQVFGEFVNNQYLDPTRSYKVRLYGDPHPYERDNISTNSTSVKTTYTDISPTFYKIAYKNDTIVLENAGFYLSSPFSNPSFFNQIFAIAQQQSNVNRVAQISLGRQQALKYVSQKTITEIITLGQDTSLPRVPVINDLYTNYPVGSKQRSFRENENLVIFTRLNNKSCICIGQITGVTYSDTYDNGQAVNVNTLTLEIIKAKETKLFDFPYNHFLLVFPVRGAEIFTILNRRRISFFEKPSNTPTGENRKFLAATMLPISQVDTQSLVFEIIDNDIVFLDVMGGEVIDSKKDPIFASQWVQYYPEETPRDWASSPP